MQCDLNWKLDALKLNSNREILERDVCCQLLSLLERWISTFICKMERMIAEVVGPALIGLGAFGLSSFYSVANLDKRLSKSQNQVFFCMIPIIFYALFRLHFSFLFWVTSIGNFSSIRPIACKFEFTEHSLNIQLQTFQFNNG